MKTHTINVTTKKGEVQLSRWLVAQSHPYPDAEGFSGSIRWRNGGGLFPEYGKPAAGIGQHYRCFLVIPEGEIPDNYTREQFAGYVPYASYGQPPKPANPGTITLRGRDLGEMVVEIKIGDGWPSDWVDIKVRGNDNPTQQEREMIKREIVPHLREYIERNAAELHAVAVKRIAAQMAEQVARIRASAAELEKQASEAIARLSMPVSAAA